jgi:hypothetical protein
MDSIYNVLATAQSHLYHSQNLFIDYVVSNSPSIFWSVIYRIDTFKQMQKMLFTLLLFLCINGVVLTLN